MAAALFKDGVLSLGAAARVSGLPIQSLLRHLNDLDIEVVGNDAATDRETIALSRWLKS